MAEHDRYAPAEAPAPLGKTGAAFYAEVAADRDLPPLTRMLLLEASRLVDRLEKLDHQLKGGSWTRFRRREDGLGVNMYVDRVLNEAREQAVAFKGLVETIDKQLNATSQAPTVVHPGVANLMERLTAKKAR